MYKDTRAGTQRVERVVRELIGLLLYSELTPVPKRA